MGVEPMPGTNYMRWAAFTELMETYIVAYQPIPTFEPAAQGKVPDPSVERRISTLSLEDDGAEE
jgi:hypothetical protein